MRFIERLKITYVAFREPQAVLAAMGTTEAAAGMLRAAGDIIEQQHAVLKSVRSTLEAQQSEVNRLRLQEAEDAGRLLAYQKWCVMRRCVPSEQDLARMMEK